MEDSFWEAKVRQMQQSTMNAFFEKVAKKENADDNAGDNDPSVPMKLSTKDYEMCTLIEFIIKENQPLSIVESPFWRKKLGHQQKFSKKTVKDVMIGMCVDIEKILAAEMKAAGRGSILHDRWSKFGDHYFALYASYMATRRGDTDSSDVTAVLTFFKPPPPSSFTLQRVAIYDAYNAKQ